MPTTTNKENQEAPCTEEEYQVEDIIGHREIAGKREYLVKYTGYGEEDNTYEPPYNMSGCEALIERYCLKAGIPNEEFLKSRCKNSQAEPTTSPGNHCHTAQVIKLTKSYARSLRYDKSGLLVEQFPGADEVKRATGSKLYVHLYEGHYYVYLIIPGSKSYYVSDGANDCLKPQRLRELSSAKVVGKRLTPIAFDQQSGEDHCASSAVVIMLELMRLYKNSDPIPERITIGFKKTHKEIVEIMHKTRPSATLSGKRSIAGYQAPACKYCGEKKKRTKAALLAHERKCNKRCD